MKMTNPFQLWRFGLSVFLLLITLAPAGAAGSAAIAAGKNWTVDELRQTLKADPNQPLVAHLLRVANDPAAILELTDAFKTATSTIAKQAIAAALVRIGVQDEKYWNFLASRATAAIDADIPIPIADRDGRYVKGEYNPDFLTWVSEHKIATEVATHLAIYGHPSEVLFLSLTGDPRAIPILMKGLRSRNFRIAANSAAGLARLKHAPATDEIAAACKRFPREVWTSPLFDPRSVGLSRFI